MAVITGVLSDYERKALASSSLDRAPVIEFKPSGPGVRDPANVLYASREVTVVPAVSTGAFQVDLEVNTIISPETWYEITIKWLDGARNFHSYDKLPGRLYVTGPGNFTDMYRVRNAPWFAWVDQEVVVPPPDSNPGDYVLDSISGDLYRVA